MTPSHRTEVSSANAMAVEGSDRGIRGSQRRGPPGHEAGTVGAAQLFGQIHTWWRRGEVEASQSQANSSMALDQFLAQNARLGG